MGSVQTRAAGSATSPHPSYQAPSKLLPSSYQVRRRIRGAHQYLLNHSLSEKLGLKSAPSADSVGEKTCGLSEPGKLKRNSNWSGLGIGLGLGLGLPSRRGVRGLRRVQRHLLAAAVRCAARGQ